MTICTKDRVHRFGEVTNADGGAKMQKNVYGEIVEICWKRIPAVFPGVRIDEFVVMPNHFHGIIEVVSREMKQGKAQTLSNIVGWFKGVTTHEFYEAYEKLHRFSLTGKLWQRDFFDEIIYGKTQLQAVQNYIRENPKKWARDQFNKSVKG